jgi:hypothetical protein
MKSSQNRRELSGWGLGFALETVAPESLVIKPVQVRFSNYLGQHWSLTFREDALVDLGATPQIRGAAPVEMEGMFRWGIAATAHRAAEPRTQSIVRS